ncbi:MAG: hypothetical protein QOI66_5014 [Myxococcales bacterium]|jgi:predicted dehydrogenase|nr:hypothetical protein [Myxococcales bacterium]
MSVGFCFLGCGKISLRHIRTLRRIRPDARIAVASRDARRAQEFARPLGIKDAFGSYEEALRSAYETMIVVTPPRSHFQLVKEAVANGKHLLIEKPIFNSLDEFASLWPALIQSRPVVMVAENVHFAPFHRRLKDILKNGRDCGRPLFLDLIRLGASTPKGWRADPAEMPLGALHEGGVHWIRRLMDLASVWEDSETDHVVAVTAFGPDKPLSNTPNEDTTVVLARHQSGLTSRLFHSWGVPWRFIPFDSSKVIMEKGAIYFDGRGIYGRFYGPTGKQWLAPSLRDRTGFEAMWRHFLDRIDGAAAPVLSLQHIFADFAYLDAAYRARQSRTTVVPVRPPLLVA